MLFHCISTIACEVDLLIITPPHRKQKVELPMLTHLQVPLNLTHWAFKASEKMKLQRDAMRRFINFSQTQLAQE